MFHLLLWGEPWFGAGTENAPKVSVSFFFRSPSAGWPESRRAWRFSLVYFHTQAYET